MSGAQATRIEAQPFGWRDLTDDQREGILRAHRLLADFIAQRPEAPRPGDLPLPHIDRRRRSNVVLVDGARGSGKTTVLITLLDLWSQLMATPEAGRAPESASLFASCPAADCPQALLDLLRGPLQGRLLPLEILDLQPLPDSTSLLLALATKLHPLIAALETDAPGGRGSPARPSATAPWDPAWERELPARKAWRRLVRVVAAGWESNLTARRATLDPEAYAVEIEESEGARLELGAAWRDLVDALAGELHRRHPQVHAAVRLVVSVDDADLNPRRCRELLDLVRALWHPRVVFLLTGDSDLFRAVLEHRFEQDAPAMARRLAADLFDKVVPPGHRLLLPRLEPGVRLAKVDDLLQQAVVPGDPDPRRLRVRDYFDLDPPAQEALPDRLRRIQDLRLFLDVTRSAAEIVLELWRGAAATEPEEVRELVRRGAGGGLVVGGEHKLSWRGQRRALSPHSFPEGTLEAATIRRRAFYLALREGAEQPILGPAGAVLHLALDFAADDPESSTENVSRGGAGDAATVMTASWQIRGDDRDALGEVINERPPRAPLELELRWPLPDWPAPLDRRQFEESWTKAVGISSTMAEPALVAYRAFSFLELVYRASARLDEQGPVPDLPDEATERAQRWRTLFAAMATLAAQPAGGRAPSTPGREAFARWFHRRAILLAAPEAGLPSSVANEILAAWVEVVDGPGPDDEARRRALRGRNQWLIRALRRHKEAAERDEGAAPAMANTPGSRAAMERFDGLRPEHRWSHTMRPRAEVVQEEIEKLRQRARELLLPIHFQSSPKSGSIDPFLSLAEFLSIDGDLLAAEPDWLKAVIRVAEQWNTFGNSGLEVLKALRAPFLAGATTDAARAWLALAYRIENGELRVTPSTWSTDKWEEIRLPGRWSLRLGMDFQIRWPEMPASGIPPFARALLILAEQVLVDATDGELPKVPWAPAQFRVDYRGRPVDFPCALPDWPSHGDRWADQARFGAALKTAHSRLAERAPEERGEVVDAILDLLLRSVGERQQPRTGNIEPQAVQLAPFRTWWYPEKSLGEFIGVPDRYQDGRRSVALGRWLVRGLPLFAAPEMAMSAPGAHKMLAESSEGIRKILNGQSTGPGFARSFELLFGEKPILPPKDSKTPVFSDADLFAHWRKARRARAEQAMIDSGRQTESVEQGILKSIDQEFPDHPWITLVEKG